MPTLFERLDVGLAGNDLSLRVSVQAGNLNAVASTVAGLINQPPQSVEDLLRSLRELPLPDLTASGELVGTINSLKAVMPSDFSSVTGTLTGGFQKLEAGLATDIASVLDETLQALSAVNRLTRIDLTCGGMSAGAGGTATANATATAAGGGAAAGAATTAGAGTAAASSSSQPARAEAVFDRFPSPLNVETSLAWLRDVAGLRQRINVPFSLPLVDDLADPLETMHAWKAMPPAAVRDHLAATLSNIETFINGSVDALLGALAADLSETAARLHTGELTEIADGLTARLVELRAAVEARDLGGTGATVTAVNNLLDRYDALRPVLQAEALARLPSLTARLGALPEDLEGRATHLISVLRPSSLVKHLEPFTPEAVESNGLAELEAAVQEVADWVQELVNKLDLTALQGPISEVAQKARGAVETLDESMVTVALETQKLFGEVEKLLGQVDIEALTAKIEEAIQKFKTELTQSLAELFAPVREIVGEVIANIDAGLDTFDPEDVINSLRQVIQSLVGVLEDPAVAAALADIKSAVDAAAQELESLSFAPLTDEVINGIEEVGDLIESIDTSQLNGALQAALSAALSVLPDDLKPVTDPLLDELDGLVETGPVTLVASVQAQPQLLLDKVRQFEPGKLVGDALSKPFEDLLKQMDAFKPSLLLEPVQDELDKLKDRLRTSANPGRAIQPLEQPFAELTRGFDALRPDELIKPLEQQISRVTDGLLEALPVDELTEQAGAVLGQAEEIVGALADASAFMQKLQDTLGGFTDTDAQMKMWADNILAKIEAVPNPASLQTQFANISAALDRTRAAAISARFDGAADPLLAALNLFDGQARLTALIQAYRGVSRTKLAALADSPQKAALAAALDRFNPMQPVFGDPFQRLDEWRQSIAATKTTLQAALAEWDGRYHQEGGTLACLRLPVATPAELRQRIREALEPQLLRPLAALFAILEPFSRALGALLAPVRRLVADVQAKLASLLTGPDSLGGINESLQRLVQRLREFDLGFLRQSLADVHEQVRGKLEAVSPARFREVVEQSFEEMLSTLDLGQVISPADLAALDADYAEVIDKLKQLDPGALVVEVVQPEFEAKVIPLLASFDLSRLLEVLVERLRGLREELERELERVNEAYRALRRSLPSLSGGVEVGISF